MKKKPTSSTPQEAIPQPPISPFTPIIDRMGSTFTQTDLEALIGRLLAQEDMTDEGWKAIREKLAWKHIRELMGLGFQQYIDQPPLNNAQLYSRAASGDTITVETWRQKWLDNMRSNLATYDVKGNSAQNVWGTGAYRPAIIAGSGPSLKKNAHELLDRGDIPLVSCLHNFAFFEDMGIHADYYLNLDAGEITIPEMAQGGKKDPEHYWELTKGRTLVTALTGHPDLIKKWRGRVLWFNVPIPDGQMMRDIQEMTDFNLFYSVGGNALGSCLYHAKAILGANPIIFVGADFSFSYDKKFHPFDSPYDQEFSGVIPWTDVFGNRCYTWPSYLNFKSWFDHIACGGRGGNPGTYINCTEGGVLGSYAEGNIRQIRQADLHTTLAEYKVHKPLPDTLKNGFNDIQLLF